MKKFTIIATHKGRDHEYTGTLTELISDVFGYTLECGHSWNSKINLNPKSARSLVSALNKSADATNSYDDFYELKA